MKFQHSDRFIYIKRDSESDSHIKDYGINRHFVVEINTKTLGIIHVHGFYHGNLLNSRLDLIIKSNKSFKQDMQREIINLFNNFKDTLNINGALSFDTDAGVPTFYKDRTQQKSFAQKDIFI